MVEKTKEDHSQPHHHHVRTLASAEDYPLDRMLDPCNDRPVPTVPKPPRYEMTSENLFHTVDGTFLSNILPKAENA